MQGRHEEGTRLPKPGAAAREDLDRLIQAADRLPTLPAVAIEVLRLARDEDASIEDVAYTIARDPALSAKLLRMANSSLFRRGAAVTTLQEATMRLGLKTVKLMALSFSLAEAFPRNGDRAGFDYGRFWRQSLITTVAARTLARLVHSPHENEAFVCGLLSHIGELVLAECAPEGYAALRTRTGEGTPCAALEREMLGFDRHEAASILLRSWQIPELLWQSVLWYGQPDAAPPEVSSEVRELAVMLHLADTTASLIGDDNKGEVLGALVDLAREHYGLAAAETEAFVVGLEGGIRETALLLNVKLPSAESHEALLDQARRQLMELSVVTAADLEEATRRTEELERRNRELATKAHVDALTGLPNRARFDDYLQAVIEARLEGRGEYALGVLMIDVDRFKRLNDEFGHPAGDEVLRHVARTIAENVRDTSFAARYGGEEFVIVVPNVTLKQLELVSERLRRSLADTEVMFEDRRHHVTVSIGGACVDAVRSSDAGLALVAQADECLYEAKRAGRDCCVCRHLEGL